MLFMKIDREYILRVFNIYVIGNQTGLIDPEWPIMCLMER